MEIDEDEDEELDILFGEKVSGHIDDDGDEKQELFNLIGVPPSYQIDPIPFHDREFLNVRAAARRENLRRYREWMPNVPIIREHGNEYKWVNGERYMKTHQKRPAYEVKPFDPGADWVVTPLVNTNVLSQDILIHLYAYTPLYTIASSCSLVCKDWRRAFKRVPDSLWFDKLYGELKVKPHMVDPFTPLMYIQRRMRAVHILRQMLEHDEGDSACSFYLVWKGFPLPAQRRLSDKIADNLITKWRIEGLTPRPSKGDKAFWSSEYKVVYQLGPFTEDEFGDCTKGSDTLALYVKKLLILIGYLNLVDLDIDFDRSRDEFRKRGRDVINRFGNKERPRVAEEGRVVAITSLAYFLGGRYNFPIRLSQRMYMGIERGYENLAFRKYRDKKAEARKIEKRLKKRLKKSRSQHEQNEGGPQEASEPDILNIIFEFWTGFYVDILALTQKGPWSAKYQPTKFSSVVLIHPMYIQTTVDQDEEDTDAYATLTRAKVARKGIKIVVIQSGKIVVLGCKTPEMVQKVYEDTKSILLPFKTLGPMAEKELKRRFAIQSLLVKTKEEVVITKSEAVEGTGF